MSRTVREVLVEKTEKLFAMEIVEDEEELNSRNIDALDDECLMHFVTFGRHINGISQKQKRRVDKIQSHYKQNDIVSKKSYY